LYNNAEGLATSLTFLGEISGYCVHNFGDGAVKFSESKITNRSSGFDDSADRAEFRRVREGFYGNIFEWRPNIV
jgi:hypothetical protein